MKRVINSLQDLDLLVKFGEIEPANQVASYDVSDSDISGGRKIIDVKSNQLFTGRFEERDINDFI